MSSDRRASSYLHLMKTPQISKNTLMPHRPAVSIALLDIETTPNEENSNDSVSWTWTGVNMGHSV